MCQISLCHGFAAEMWKPSRHIGAATCAHLDNRPVSSVLFCLSKWMGRFVNVLFPIMLHIRIMLLLSEGFGFYLSVFSSFFFFAFFFCCHFHNNVGSLSSLLFWMLMTHFVINPVCSCKYSVGSCHQGFLFWQILTPHCCLVMTFCRMGSRLPPRCPWRTHPRRYCTIWGRTPRSRGKRALKMPPRRLPLPSECPRCSCLSSCLHQALGSNRSHKSWRGSCSCGEAVTCKQNSFCEKYLIAKLVEITARFVPDNQGHFLNC